MSKELGMPTNFYQYQATYPHNYTGWSSVGTRPTNDNGVFVSDNYEWGPAGNTNYQGVFGHPHRVTTLNNRGGHGGINMHHTDMTYINIDNITTFVIAKGSASSSTSCGLVIHRGESKNATIYANSKSQYVLLSCGLMETNNGYLTVHKTELACPYDLDGVLPSAPFECVYTTGISAIVTHDDGTFDAQSVIIARVPALGKDYPEVLTNSPYWCPGGSIIMTGSGSVSSLITGDTLTSVSIVPVAQSIPESAMVSNDGILAVACMVTGDGYARWLGYKNGIYKLYQGRTPLNGMPGEKVTIKGHEFVCLAYGPFYARMT